jgi:ATP-dependent Lhr-like helicase
MAQSGLRGGPPSSPGPSRVGGKRQRAIIEDDLKSGALRCVVATSSLELGIAHGRRRPGRAGGGAAVGGERAAAGGRAGHQVGRCRAGVFPKHRATWLQSAVASRHARRGRRAARDARQPARRARPADRRRRRDGRAGRRRLVRPGPAGGTVRRAPPLGVRGDPRPARRAVPVGPVRRAAPTDRLGPSGGDARRQARRATSGRHLRRHDPDRGLFGVFLLGADSSRGSARVGELDEEMVYESRVGDVFALGASSWRIEDITHDACW